MRTILAILLIALANLAQAAVISLNNSGDIIGRGHDSQHESWVVIIAKGDSTIAFANQGILDAKPICSRFKTDEHLQPAIDKELLPFFAVGDTIMTKFQHQEDEKILTLSITIGDAVIKVGKDVTPPAFNRLVVFEAELRGQKILVDCFRDQVPIMDEDIYLLCPILKIFMIPDEGKIQCRAHLGGPADVREPARDTKRLGT